jgi:hypothetical protein
VAASGFIEANKRGSLRSVEMLTDVSSVSLMQVCVEANNLLEHQEYRNTKPEIHFVYTLFIQICLLCNFETNPYGMLLNPSFFLFLGRTDWSPGSAEDQSRSRHSFFH